MADAAGQHWDLIVDGRSHHVTASGRFKRTVIWCVDGAEVARITSTNDRIVLRPPEDTDAQPPTESGPGAIEVRFSNFGTPQRATHFQRYKSTGLGTLPRHEDGTELTPATGSPAARRETLMREHPRRFAAQTVAIAGGQVVAPILLSLIAAKLVINIPWPQVDLPAIPWPNIPWPQVHIPWPDWHLPQWQAPAWVGRVREALRYVWPILLAAFLAQRELKRRRTQDVKRTATGNTTKGDTTASSKTTGNDTADEPQPTLVPPDSTPQRSNSDRSR